MAQASLACSACGQQFELTPDYVAQYAGQTTTCPCGNELSIPAIGTPSTVQLSYAAPARASSKVSANVWRDDQLLMMTRGARLPNRCADCGTPVERKFRLITLFRAVPFVSITGFLVRRFMSDSVRVRYGYCREHMHWVESEIGRITFFASCAAIPACIAAASLVENRSFVVFWILIALTIAAMALAVSFFAIAKSIKIHNLDYKHVWLIGFDDAYLQHLPSIQEKRDRDARQTAARLNSMDG
ncbi:MAG: hypothetical protein JWN40_4491 [Phycisphaerales bacterium]|nr:hypothetical protein [Phycisphaerales bacterium]